MTVDNQNGNLEYARPEAAGEDWISEVREKYGLPKNASSEQIEPVAIRLITNPLTRLTGAELVLNRRVDVSEKMIEQVLYRDVSPREIFMALLVEKTLETVMKEKGFTDFGTQNRVSN